MPWNSGSFIGTMTSWFSSLSDKTETQTAQTIAQAYSSAAVTTQTFFGSLPILVGPISGIEQGFLESFNSAKEIEEGEPEVNIWLSAASSIITYWTGAQFLPLPPPPGGSSGNTNTVLVPGIPLTLAADLKTAFSQDTPTDAATQLNQAFVNHLTTIQGLWVGQTSSSPPTPFSFPWVSLT